MAVMNFSEAMRKSLLEQGYKWVRNSKDLGEIEKLALQYYDTQILYNRATGTYSLYVFGRKMSKAMFGKFEVAGVIVKEGDVEVIPKDAPAMHFKDITSFEDEKLEHFPEAEETIAEELIERDIPPEEWEEYGIGPEVVERVEKKKKIKEATLIEYGVEPMWVRGKKGEKIKTLFAFGEKSIDVRSVPTPELEEALRTGLYQGFELKSEDAEIIKEEIRRRKEEEIELEKQIVDKRGKLTACPECSAEVGGKERWWAHLKIHHPKIYEQLKAEERAERRRKARERAKKIPEDAKFIASALNIDVFTANSILNRILSQDQDWQVVDWVAIGEVNWRRLYDRDEYLRQIEERVMRYGINLHPVEEAKRRELEAMQEEFETDQLENLLEEIYIEGANEDRVEFLKANAPTLIKMAQRGVQRAKVALADFFPDVPMEQYLRPEEMKGRKGPPKITAKELKTDREIAKQLDDKTLEEVLKRRKLFGRVLVKKEAEIFAEELEMRRKERTQQLKDHLKTLELPLLKEMLQLGTYMGRELEPWEIEILQAEINEREPVERPPVEPITDRERQIAEVKALIAPLMTSQLEEMVRTETAFGMKIEPWALEIIKEELKQRELGITPVIHGTDYPDVIRLIAEAKTIREFDAILGDIARRRYILTESDILELTTRAIEKRGRREEELREMEMKEEKPPARPPRRPPEGEREPPISAYPEPFIEMDVCTTCGITSPNLDFDTRGVLSYLLRIPVHLFDACQRCVIGVHGYGDILTYISNAVANPRKYDLSRSDLEWLRKVERTIRESEMVVMFAVDVETAFTLGSWLYKYYKGEILSIGLTNVFVTHRDEIVKAFGREVAEELGAAKIASAMLTGRWLGRQKLKTPKTTMDAVVNQVFPKFMLDWVEYGADYVLEHHNITLCAMLSRFGFRVVPTGELIYGRPKCTISDDVREELINSVINLTPDMELEEVEMRG